MSLPHPPPRPTEGEYGLTPEVRFMQIIWDILWDPKTNLFCDHPNLQFSKTTRGYVPNIRIPSAKQEKTQTPSGFKLMAIKQLGSNLTPPLPDLLICSSVTMVAGNPSIANDTIYVAKRREMRQIAKEFFYDNGANVIQTYTYFGPTLADPSYGDNFRTGADGSFTELESVVPRYITANMLLVSPKLAMPVDQSLIEAADLGAATGVKDPTGKDVTMLEQTPREWAKVVNV